MQKEKASLNLITLIPTPAVCSEIKLLKEELKDRFSISHALRLPAHITLQRPFRVLWDNEFLLHEELSRFAEKQKSFPVYLNGTDHFSSRVIFIKIANPRPVVSLWKNLMNSLPESLFQHIEDKQKQIHPHITLAHRDLKKDLFPQVWEDFKNLKYQAEFEANKLVLFRHDGKNWLRNETYSFSE